jgi:outer membrane protein OmpA-like peptidoglycan-associated protein
VTFGVSRSAAVAAPADNSALNAQINDLRSQLANAENSYKARIADLQNQLNAANNRNSQLQKDLDDCQKSKSGMIDKALQYMTILVHFPVNKTAVSADQEPNVERIAAYMKSHPEAKCTINGYASKDGPADHNIKLAEGRAASVKDMLVKKYGINAKRINAKGQGISNMFDELSWNRVSICEITVK